MTLASHGAVGIAAVYPDLVTNNARNRRRSPMSWPHRDRDRHCLMLNQFTAHVEVLAELLRDAGGPVLRTGVHLLRGGST